MEVVFQPAYTCDVPNPCGQYTPLDACGSPASCDAAAAGNAGVVACIQAGLEPGAEVSFRWIAFFDGGFTRREFFSDGGSVVELETFEAAPAIPFSQVHHRDIPEISRCASVDELADQWACIDELLTTANDLGGC
ncbi:MAG: hypothetical protein AAGA54_12100 [Myxococcota bacterium]